jgi:hypothetical protein
MPDDINELDVTDAGLKAVMGKRFHDETQSESKKVISKKETTTKEETKKDPHKPTHTFKDGKWEPIKENTWHDNLKSCARWVVAFGGLSFLLFYWKEAGLMAESVAVPSIAICSMLAGFSAGRCARGCK